MYEHHQAVGTSGSREARISERLYTRLMPGGGCVRVELLDSATEDESADHLRGRVMMERRASAPAMPEDEDVVVAELEGDDSNAVMAELFRIARDNAAIARRVLQRPQPVQRGD